MAQPQLEGTVDNRDALIEQLEIEVKNLRRDLLAARAEAANEIRSNAAAVAALRHQLEPLHLALKALFGEIDKVSGAEAAPATSTSPRTAAVWESWKQRLPTLPGKIIDALLVHGELNTQQLAIAVGCNRNSIPNGILALNKAGLINKSGGRFSLKEI